MQSRTIRINKTKISVSISRCRHDWDKWFAIGPLRHPNTDRIVGIVVSNRTYLVDVVWL